MDINSDQNKPILIEKTYIKADGHLGAEFRNNDDDEEQQHEQKQPSKSIDDILKTLFLDKNLNFFEELCIMLKNEKEEQFEENLHTNAKYLQQILDLRKNDIQELYEEEEKLGRE